MNDSVARVIAQFELPQGDIEAEGYGNGHINNTFRLTVKCADGDRRYILQRVNSYVFPQPVHVIENIEKVTAHLASLIRAQGGDPERETLTLVKARDGRNYVIADDGELWRTYLFVEKTKSVDLPDTEALFELSGRAFGKFQKQLGGFDASQLHETIVDFHNTPARYRQLMDAVRCNEAGRLGEVGEELAFCMEHSTEVGVLLRALENGEIPLRVTHNDTKLNNVLLDEKTGEGVCVIDLDTVMPGLSAYDFGDSVRFGASTGAEDEKDLSKIEISLPMFAAFSRGFLASCGDELTAREKELLPMGAKLMTLECGMRFLADYLNGDKYFRVHRPGHNLDRARTQFKLVRSMEEHWDEMTAIIDAL